jgi:transcriptional regulator with XRE-family HTH domain
VAPIDPDRLLDDVGRRVAELRRENGWTQQDFADELGVTLRHAQAIEGGEQNLSLRAVVRVANALGVPLAAIFEAPAARRRRPGRPRKR